MEPYSIEFLRPASKELEDLPIQVGRRIAAAVDTLAVDPRRHGSMKLREATNRYRLRVGSYRILYEIHEASRTSPYLRHTPPPGSIQLRRLP